MQLQVNQRAEIDLELEVGLISETVTIAGTAPLLETQSSVLGTVIEEKQVQDLPLSGRNFVQLATLSPGVSGAGSGMRGTIMSGTRPDDLRPGTELFVNGNRENSNNYLYDGIDNNTRLTLVTVLRPNVEAIKEFKVQTNLYSADQGRNPGGQINVVTKSGGNTMHGVAYEFLRNAKFDANNFFANRAGQDKPPFEQNQFGGAIGGPIIANKTFFFADYDGFRQELGRVFVNTVPTAKMRQGDFSEVGTIYDPLTTVVAPGGAVTRQPFAGNLIPQNRWDPVTAKLMNAYPMPTTSALSSNLVTTPSRTQNWNQFDVRVDHTQSDRNNFLGRYSWSKTSTINPYTFAPVQLPGLSKAVGLGNEDTFAGPSDLWAEHAVFGWVHVFSERLLLDSRAGYNHFNLEFTQADVVNGDQLGEQLGVPNANQQLGQDGIPIFSPANYTGIGHSRSLPIFRHEKMFQYVTNLTFQGDKHTIKTGFDLRRRHMGEFQTNRGNGRFNFAPNITNNPANNTGGHVMASFLLGAPSLIEQDYLLASDVGMRSTEYGLYIADDWRATQRLTLNLGLRYELDTPFTEVDNLWANFDPNTATVLVAGRNGVSRSAGVNTFKKAFAPRLGFAYQVAQRTVVRGGAGLFWNTPGNGGAALRLHRHVPFGPIYSFNPGTQFVTRRVADGFPTIPPMDLTLADNPSGSVIGVDPNYQPGYAEQFNLTVEQELPSALLLKVSYVGNIGKHLDTTYNLNQAVPGTGAVNNRRPFFDVRPALADVNWAVSDGTAVVPRASIQRPEEADAWAEWPSFVYLVSWHRHGRPELRGRRGRSVAARSAQSTRESRQLAVRYPSSFDHRLELRAARRVAGQRHQHIPDRSSVHADAEHDDDQYRDGPAPRPHRRRQVVGPDGRPLVRHVRVYDAGTVRLWQRGTEHPVRAGTREFRLLAVQGIPRQGRHAGPISRRDLQSPEHSTIRSAECLDRRSSGRHDHRHRRHAPPNSVRWETRVLI